MKWQLAFLFMAVGYFLAPVHAEQVKYYYTDAQGTVLATTDAQGNIFSTNDYRPYGLLALGQSQDGPGYTGHV
ncbi:MAG TPA: RHS repeat-associated core domain-containing protein, partial [Luteibacter sp.]|nr:RHS repeat-associated core domain-containing protein [Luteibacter sp.]